VVVKVNVEVAAVLPGVGAAGANEQLDCAGSPVQLSATDELKVPPTGVTVTV